MPLYQSLVKKLKDNKKNQFQIFCVFLQTLYNIKCVFKSDK